MVHYLKEIHDSEVSVSRKYMLRKLDQMVRRRVQTCARNLSSGLRRSTRVDLRGMMPSLNGMTLMTDGTLMTEYEFSVVPNKSFPRLTRQHAASPTLWRLAKPRCQCFWGTQIDSNMWLSCDLVT